MINRYYDLLFCCLWGLAVGSCVLLCFGRGRRSLTRTFGALILFALCVYIFHKAITREYQLGFDKAMQIRQKDCEFISSNNSVYV